MQMYGDVVDGIDAHRFEEELTRLKEERGAEQDVDLSADDLERAGRPLQGDLPRRVRPRLPAGSARAAPAGRGRPSSTPGTRRARRCTGVRTGSRTTSARRRTSCRWCSATRATPRPRGSPSPANPRPASRGCTASSSSTPRARTSSPVSRTPEPLARMAEVLPQAYTELAATMQRLEAALPGDAGHRVHGRGGQALPPADPHGQAHRRSRAADRRRHGRRGADLARGGRRAHRRGPARPAPASDDRPRRGGRSDRRGPERLAGRGDRRRRLRRGHRRGSRPSRGGGHPRALGDDAGRHPRPDLGARRADRARRHDLARRRGRARDGQAARSPAARRSRSTRGGRRSTATASPRATC